MKACSLKLVHLSIIFQNPIFISNAISRPKNKQNKILLINQTQRKKYGILDFKM